MVFFVGQVFIPRTAYKGQKLIKLVAANMTVTTIRNMPSKPVTVSV